MLIGPNEISPVLSSIGTNRFGTAVLRIIEDEYDISYCMVFEQFESSSPRCIVAEGKAFSYAYSRGDDLIGEWTSNDYSADPVLRHLRCHATEIPRIDVFDCLDFHLSNVPDKNNYIDRYVISTNVAQEITCSRIEGDRLVWVSVGREAKSPSLTPAQQHELESAIQLILTGAERQAQIMDLLQATISPEPQMAEIRWASTRSNMLTKIQNALIQHSSHLTQREAEICAHIVVGYQVRAISLNLDISINTVATHKKRAYAKLGISSQTELFNNCLKHGLMN